MRDVIVLGAGPAGSAAAAALARRGHDVLVLERDRFPRHKVCGEFVSPEARATLHALGVLDAMALLEPVRLAHARIVSAAGRDVRVGLPDVAWGLSRHAFDARLAKHAVRSGAELRTRTRVVDWSGDGGAYTVRVTPSSGMASPETTSLQARAVLVALGRRAHPRPRHASRDRGLHLGLNVHFEGVTMPAQVELYLFRGGYAGVNPIESKRDGTRRVNVGMLVDPERLARTARPGRGAWVEAVASHGADLAAQRHVLRMLDVAAHANPALGRRLASGRALAGSARAVAPVILGAPAQPWEAAPHLGDAAQAIAPLCGDGIAMALRSAELAADCTHAYLEGQLDFAGWKAVWVKAWHREFDARLHVGRRLQRLFEHPRAAEALFTMAPLWPGLLPRLTRHWIRATRGPMRAPASYARSKAAS